jgi:hypothetical protein
MSGEDIDQLRADSKRLRWLLSGHTVDELDACNVSGQQPVLAPQDLCINALASWYCTLDESLATIDAAMKAAE